MHIDPQGVRAIEQFDHLTSLSDKYKKKQQKTNGSVYNKMSQESDKSKIQPAYFPTKSAFALHCTLAQKKNNQ